MSHSLSLPLLDRLVPGGLTYGASYVVEFEPQSLWYETSLTITALGLRQGVRTEYHTFMHPADEVREEVRALGVNVESLERKGAFRIIDTYAASTGLRVSKDHKGGALQAREDSLDVAHWGSEAARMIEEGVPENERGWLHVDDNTSILYRYNEEKVLLDFWRTRLIPYVKTREIAMIAAHVTGIASETFYRQLESFCDGILDFKSEEESGRMEQYARVRSIKGKTCDSRWQHLRLTDSGEVSIAASQPMAAFSDKPYYKTTPVMDYLVRAFTEDYMHRRDDLQQSGWRSLPEIARTVKIPQSQVYGDPRYGHTFGGALEPLIQEGLVEYRFFSGKGRGGRVLKLRVQYEKEPVRRLVDAAAFKPSRRNP